MRVRAYGCGIGLFAGLTVTLVINLTSFQTGTRSLAPAPLPVGLGQKSATKPSDPAQVVILNKQTRYRDDQIENRLSDLGYLPKSASGDAEGLLTSAAIMAFEYDNGLPLTAEASQMLLDRLTGRAGKTALISKSAGLPVTDRSKEVLKAVQVSLASLNYEPGAADGGYSPSTERAIRNFEIDTRLPETGRVSGQLMAALLTRLSKRSLKVTSN